MIGAIQGFSTPIITPEIAFYNNIRTCGLNPIPRYNCYPTLSYFMSSATEKTVFFFSQSFKVCTEGHVSIKDLKSTDYRSGNQRSTNEAQ